MEGDGGKRREPEEGEKKRCWKNGLRTKGARAESMKQIKQVEQEEVKVTPGNEDFLLIIFQLHF